MPTESTLSSLNSEMTVVVWEHPRSRLEPIERVISDCGARPLLISGLAAIDDLRRSPTCCFAIVPLGVCPSECALILEAIQRLKSLGFSVIAHEQGLDAWDLSARCRVLLAGSLCLLDSAKPEFLQTLQSTLTGMLQRKACEQQEIRKIKDMMLNFGMVGESEAILSIFRQVIKISLFSDLPVLISGETGTGKELVARALHRLDPKRSTGPFVAINCGAIHSGVAESELFGHKKGAFTGADRDRKGLFRSAHGGVLFLDEIGELSGDLQAKLLRVLQEKSVLGVGDDQEASVDCRIIAATNRDLEHEAEQHKFRVDLFHRLNVLSVYLCPLRERSADVKPLVEHFLAKYRCLAAADTIAIAPSFFESLSQLNLQGNVRELENLVRRALVNKKDQSPLGLSDLPVDVLLQLCERQASSATQAACLTRQETSATENYAFIQWLVEKGWDLAHSLDYCERLLLESALHHAGGNQTKIAELLGITPRSVYNKLRKHRLEH